MRLLRFHPDLVLRDCTDCLIHHYDEAGKPSMRRGKPMRRPAGTAPCQTSEGCPKGTPENPAILWPRHYQTIAHYRECKAVGAFPDDPIVRRNAVLLDSVEKESDRRSDMDRRNEMLQLMRAMRG